MEQKQIYERFYNETFQLRSLFSNEGEIFLRISYNGTGENKQTETMS